MTGVENHPPEQKVRRIERGEWTASESPRTKPRAERTVSVKMTEAELAEFDDQIALLGINRNRALRIAARRIAGFMEVLPEQIETLRRATRQLSGIATNVNQIARAGNRTRSPDYRAFMAERAALGHELVRIESQIQTILDLATRRTDGLTRLAIAAGK